MKSIYLFSAFELKKKILNSHATKPVPSLNALKCANQEHDITHGMCRRSEFLILESVDVASSITPLKILADGAQWMVASDGAIIGFKSSRVVFVVS